MAVLSEISVENLLWHAKENFVAHRPTVLNLGSAALEPELNHMQFLWALTLVNAPCSLSSSAG